jgi:hypothetical protein
MKNEDDQAGRWFAGLVASFHPGVPGPTCRCVSDSHNLSRLLMPMAVFEVAPGTSIVVNAPYTSRRTQRMGILLKLG